MTPSDLYLYIHYKLNTTSTDFSNTNMLMILNAKMYDICGAIAMENQGYFGEAYTFDIKADKRDYDLPDEILNNLIMIEAKIDGSDWERVRMESVHDIKDFVYQEGWITDNYSSEEPHGIIIGKKLTILSGTLSDVTDGIRVWYKVFPRKVPAMGGTIDLSVITDPRRGTLLPSGSTTTVSFPFSFHELLARAIVRDYKEVYSIPLRNEDNRWEQDLKNKLQQIKPMTLDESFCASTEKDDGSDY